MLPWKIIQMKVMCEKLHALVIYQNNRYIYNIHEYTFHTHLA